MDNNNNFFPLDYTHEELEHLFNKLNKGWVLSEENYKKLINEIGLDNISTFSGKYEDLKNIPDFVKEIEASMATLDIETKANVNKKIVTMTETLRSDISKAEQRLNKTMSSVQNDLNAQLADTKNSLSNSIKNIEKTIDESISIAMDEMSAKLTTAENRIAANMSDIVALENNVDVLDERLDSEVNILDNRLDQAEEKIQAIIDNPDKGMTDEERALLNELGVEVKAKFDHVEARNLIDEDKNVSTELVFYSGDKIVDRVSFAGGGGSGGGTGGGTLSTTLDAETYVAEKDSVIIPYTFKSPNYGDATMYMTVVNGASSKEVEYTIKRQGAGSINLGVISKGINVISMYIVDSFSQMTNIVEITVIVGALEISSTFDDGKDFESYNTISIPLTVSPLNADEVMTLFVDIDGKVFTQQVYNGFNTFVVPTEAKTSGVHKLVLQVRSDKFNSNKLEYNIVIIDRNALLVSAKDTELEIEFGYNLDLEFRVSTVYTSTYHATYYIDDIEYAKGEVVNGDNKFTISYRDLAIKEYEIRIVVKTADEVMTGELVLHVNVKPTVFERIEHVTAGLQAYFDMSVKSNSDPDRERLVSMVPMDNGEYAELVLHDYNFATNGWLNGRLVNNGKAWAEIINYLPLENNVLEGFTFDILFKNFNSGIAEARVVDCMSVDPPIGFYIDSEKAMASTDANDLNTVFTDRTDMRITFVVNRTSTYFEEYIIDPETGHSIKNPNPTYKPNPMIQTYVDGVFTDVAMLSDSGTGNNKIYESFMNTENVLINTDRFKEVFGNNEIKSIRIYNRPLDHEDVLRNYMADYDDLMEQKAIYDKNYVTVDSDLPTLYFYDSEIGKCDDMTKDNKQWINIVYTSPNKELYGESFDLMGQCQWQGTSSLAYPVKNYKFKLYDWARDEEGNIIEALRNDKDSYVKKKIDMYPSSGNGHKENTFCIKVDYMDSSHCRNTGTAKLVNDFLFDGHPNPAKQVDPKTRDTINGHVCQLYINGKWIGLCNFNHDKSCTKTLGLETIENTVRWEIKANSDSSAGAFIKTWTNVEECYNAILTDFEIVFDEDAFEDKTGVYDVTKYYDELDFDHEGPVVGSYYDYAILSLARFVNFVSGADEEDFKNKAGEYFDVVQACRYYLNTMTLGMIDNFAKNCIINMYGDDIWWFSFYDMDSSLGLDNTGYKKFDPNIEPSQPGIYNCSTSRMWVKLNEYLKDELFDQFKLIRENKYTYENICDYLIGKQIDVIPQSLYNKDMYTKYISQGRQYLHMLHGNNKDHLKRWLYDRFLYVDSLFLQHNSPYTKQNITVRSCAPKDAVPKYDGQGNIISPYTARFEIQTYSPQYVTVCWRKNTFETKRIDYGETVVFECDMVNSQDNELIIYCATNLKSLGDCSGLNPTSIDIGAANRLIEFKCENSDMLVKADISKNTFLNKVSFSGCSLLGTASGGANVLDISNSTNLKEVDIRGTKITSVLTNPKGGNLQKILYPDAIQNVVLDNQVNLEVVGLPFENKVASAKNLATVNISNCNFIKHLNYPYNEGDPLDFGALKYVQYLTVDNSLKDMPVISFKNFDKLKEITINNMPYLQDIDFIDLLPHNATSTFEKISLANIPQVKDISFNVTSNNHKIAFVDGATIDLGALNLNSIESNTGIQGANKLILPIGLKELRFTTEFGSEMSDIKNIWSFNAVHINDGFEGMDLKDMNLTHIDMTGLPQITHAINFNITPANQNPNLNAIRDGKTKPFFRPEGTINLNNYTGSMVNVLKGIDLGKLNVVLTNPKIQNDLTSLFEGAIIPADKLSTVNNIINKFEYAVKFDKMFKEAKLNGIVPSQIELPLGNKLSLAGMYEGSDVTEDLDLPTSNILSVNSMFKDCLGITELRPNWEKSYVDKLDTKDCYLGCVSADLDQVPAAWGGYGFDTLSTGLYVFNAPTENYVLQITPSADLILSKGYVNWGDGTISRLSPDNLTHTYKKAGLYEVKAQCIPGGKGTALLCADSLIEVKQLPTGAPNYYNCFSGAVNLQRVTAHGLVFENWGIKGMFNGCKNLTVINGIETWDVSRCTDCGSLFANCESLTDLDLSKWNAANCSSAFHLFYQCKNLRNLDVSGFNVSNVLNFQNAFNGCESLEVLDLTNWATSSGTIINGMFCKCNSLREIIGLEGFTLDKVELISAMFQDCGSLRSVNLGGINVALAGGLDYMFDKCTELTDLVAPKNINKSLNVSYSSQLNVTSLMSIINNLATISEPKTLTLGPILMAKLSPEQIKVATEKGWSVA